MTNDQDLRTALKRVDVRAEADGYEFRADEGDYTPTEHERAMLEDFGNGLITRVEEELAPKPTGTEAGRGVGDDEPDDLLWLRYQVLALCEDTEDKCAAAIDKGGLGVHEAGFQRGRKYEAKGIRRAIAEVVRCRLADRAATPTPLTPANTARGDETSQAARDVLAERHRQVEVEGWKPEHDDAHGNGEMAIAAACYATAPPATYTEREWMFADRPKSWPWHSTWWKPTFYRRNLVKAGALIVSEIERLDRLSVSTTPTPPAPDSTAQGDGTSQEGEDEPDDLLWLRRQVLLLCEDTEDKTSVELEKPDLIEHERGFLRGQAYEAKGIRRAIAEVVRCRLADRKSQLPVPADREGGR